MYIMPYIRNISSIVNHADACGGGMKKAGIVGTSGWTRIPRGILYSNSPSKVPTFTLTCCDTVRRGSSGYTSKLANRGNMN